MSNAVNKTATEFDHSQQKKDGVETHFPPVLVPYFNISGG